MNSLIPFTYQGLKTTEAVISLGPLSLLKRFRMTRRGWGEFFGARDPVRYISHLKGRYPFLPSGVVLTVSTTDGKSYETFTLDIFDGFQYATYSELPKAKVFVRGFPMFQQALMEGKIPLPDPTLAEIAALPKWTHGKGALLKAAAEKESVDPETIRRWANKVAAGIPLGRHVTPYIHTRYRDIYEKAVKLIEKNKRIEDISAALNVPKATLYRWKNKTRGR